jgi:hypothetical protein
MIAMKDGLPKERRAVCRYVLEDDFEAIVPNQAILIRVRDLSERGIKFIADQLIPQYSAIVINFDMYPVNFALRALVVWSRDSGKNHYVHGAEFVNLQDEEALLLKDFVKTLRQAPASE